MSARVLQGLVAVNSAGGDITLKRLVAPTVDLNSGAAGAIDIAAVPLQFAYIPVVCDWNESMFISRHPNAVYL